MYHLINIHKSDLTPMDCRELKVVTMISNPMRFKNRYNLYRKFAKHMHDSGVDLYTVEVVQHDRPFEITQADNPFHFQLRTDSILWIKENCLNLAIQRLPTNWKYVAWIDADILFSNPHWAESTIQQLQIYKIVQMWSTCHDLNPAMDTFATYRSFCWCHHYSLRNPERVGVMVNGRMQFNQGIPDFKSYATLQKPFWHSGFAWVMRRETFEDLGGLFQVGILGSGDHHMSLAMIHEAERSLPTDVSVPYFESIVEYQKRCERYLLKDIGYVPGSINHYAHGQKINRGYRTRWDILKRNQFDPRTDLKMDWQGLYQLTDRNIQLRDDIRIYFSQRDEDDNSWE